MSDSPAQLAVELTLTLNRYAADLATGSECRVTIAQLARRFPWGEIAIALGYAAGHGIRAMRAGCDCPVEHGPGWFAVGNPTDAPDGDPRLQAYRVAVAYANDERTDALVMIRAMGERDLVDVALFMGELTDLALASRREAVRAR